MAKKNKKYFVLMEGGADTSQVFASAQPRGAALKAASRGKTNIRLRERGTKRVHVFTGERKQVPKPPNGPDWLPDMVWKANVKKQGIEHQD
ncbi:MAG: chromosomal protein MC1 [Euryarchaeota archaeon]|nr:chromosomal protein MC1 [Euryarchaeota archaeon]